MGELRWAINFSGSLSVGCVRFGTVGPFGIIAKKKLSGRWYPLRDPHGTSSDTADSSSVVLSSLLLSRLVSSALVLFLLLLSCVVPSFFLSYPV